jgi:hypothetical protein
VIVPIVNMHHESFLQETSQETKNSSLTAIPKQLQHQRFPIREEKEQFPLDIDTSPKTESQEMVSSIQSPGQEIIKLDRPHQDAVLKQQQLTFRQRSMSSMNSKTSTKPWFHKRRKRKMLQTRLVFSSK